MNPFLNHMIGAGKDSPDPALCVLSRDMPGSPSVAFRGFVDAYGRARARLDSLDGNAPWLTPLQAIAANAMNRAYDDLLSATIAIASRLHDDFGLQKLAQTFRRPLGVIDCGTLYLAVPTNPYWENHPKAATGSSVDRMTLHVVRLDDVVDLDNGELDEAEGE